MEPLIITAAICGAEVTKQNNPAVPYTVDEMAREAKSAFDAGAAMIHLHVREDDGTPTQSAARFAECEKAIRAACPGVIIQVSTGGATGMTADERLQSIEVRPEMASLDCGTCNFGGDIFVNTEDMIEEFAIRMYEYGVVPEIEVFDKGMIDTAMRFYKKGIIKAPMHFNLAFGIAGGMNGDVRNLMFMAESLPEGASYCVTGMGRHEIPLAAVSIVMGGHVRVGFEDNVYLSKGVLAKSNGELVQKVVRLANELNRPVASARHAREILGLNK